MKDDVVNLIVAMDKSASILRLGLGITKEGHHVVEMRNLAHRLIGVLVPCLGLRVLNGVERLELTVVEAVGSAEIC